MSTDEIPVAELTTADAYRLMTDLVAPRPIAWVSTIDGQGRTNLAPFSYYQAVCSSPPTVIISAGRLPDGRAKDTLVNLLETGEATISHVSLEMAEPMNATSATYPHGVSEWEAVGVASAPAVKVAPRRVAKARGGFECRLTHAIPLGSLGKSGAPSATLLILEVVHAWVAAGLISRDERGRLLPIDPAQLEAIGRLGGNGYLGPAGTFELARPATPKP